MNSVYALDRSPRLRKMLTLAPAPTARLMICFEISRLCRTSSVEQIWQMATLTVVEAVVEGVLMASDREMTNLRRVQPIV